MTTFQWPFAASFDPQQLEAEPGPEPWMRDWPALIGCSDAERRAYLEELKARGLEPEFGYRAPMEQQIGLSPDSHSGNARSFIEQSVIFDHEGATYRLTAVEDVPPGPCPIDAPVGFASLTPRSTKLETEIPQLLVPPETSLVVGAIHSTKQWTDQMAVADPLAVKGWVRAQEQPYVLLWEPGAGHGTLKVFSVQQKYVAATAPARLSLAQRPCPMIEDSVCGQFCRMYGGPWVSAAIVAFGRWNAERTNRLADVGCDTCGNGALRVPIPIDGGLTIIDGLEPWPVAKRSDRWLTTSRYTTTVTVRR